MENSNKDQSFKEQISQKNIALIRIIKQRVNHPVKDILVVGCGTGFEAGILAREFEANTIGIDIGAEFEFDHSGSAPAKLMIMDARKLEFPENTFDLVYSFHALEHIPGPEKALKEMARVLRSGGTYLIGTPNKSRLVGYVGSATSFRNKIVWNGVDLVHRMKGKWSNEAGAHAGFTKQELLELCQSSFHGSPHPISDNYYTELYGKLASLLRKFRINAIIYPSIYVIGSKP